MGYNDSKNKPKAIRAIATNFMPIVLISIDSFTNKGNFSERNVAINRTNKLWKLMKTLTKVTGPKDMALLKSICPENPRRMFRNSIDTKTYLYETTALKTFFLTLEKINKESELKVKPR